jgi:hypothetical protein
MATNNKDFKVKHGLIVEGAQGTINNQTILTEVDGDAYILDLIGGETLITSVESTQMEVTQGELNIKSGVFDVDGAAAQALTDANDYTDTALEDYTTTANLDTTVAGYGYAKTADLPTMYSDADVDAHLSGGDGITYSAGVISADVANGLHIFNEQIQINRDTVDTWYDANGAASSAQTAAQSYADGLASNYDPAGAADTAESNANDYTDGEITTALSTAQGYANTAEANANAYTDNAVSGLNWKQAVNLLYDAAIPVLSGSGASQLVVDGHDALGDADSGYRLLLTGVTSPGIYVYNSTGGSWTLTRSEDADVYTELIGASVYVMEGTQYGSTSWVQSNHYLTDFTSQTWTQFSGQGSVTAGDGITVDGLEVSVNRTEVDTWYDAAGSAEDVQDNLDSHALDTSTHGVGEIVGTSESQTLTNKTIDAASNTLSNIDNSSLTNSSITVNGYSTDLGSSVTLDTDDVSEGTAKYFTDQRALDATALAYDTAGTAQGIVDALDTDDIEEGSTNLYFLDSRAKTSAADLLTGANLSNITITGTGAGLTITAENGVAGSTTDDLTEGEENLYFTDARAQGALNQTTPNFTAVEIESLAKHVAALVEVATASQVTAYSFAKADYRSAKFLIKTAYGSHTELSEVLLTLDSADNIAMTEYAIVGTNGSSMTVTADVDGSNVRLRVTTLNNTSVVTVVGTLLA